MTITESATNDTGTNDTPTIHASELRHLRQQDPELRILDVRTGSEFESVHIPGSYNVPLDTLAEHVARVADLEHPVVLVCQSGARASTAQAHLNRAGKSNLRVLEGGIGGWMAVGGETARGRETWALDRQVRGVAGSIVLASILASLRFPRIRLLAGGVGFGLAFSAITNTCALGMLLSKLPYNRGPQCDLDGVLSQLTA